MFSFQRFHAFSYTLKQDWIKKHIDFIKLKFNLVKGVLDFETYNVIITCWISNNSAQNIHVLSIFCSRVNIGLRLHPHLKSANPKMHICIRS